MPRHAGVVMAANLLKGTVTTMPKITFEQEEEYERLRTQRDALDQLMSKMAAYEAAIRVLIRNGLMTEFAEELAALSLSSKDSP